MTENFTDNTVQHRFELQVDGATVFADYRRQDDIVFIKHVEAPPQLRGTGAAGRLMQGIVDKARGEGFRVTPICGYAATWLLRHAEHNDLVA